VIEKAYGAFRGVVVESGDHTIEMRYRPASVFIGAALTGIATIIALLALMKNYEGRARLLPRI
jgi:uncharacterized membrane protein YfhO